MHVLKVVEVVWSINREPVVFVRGDAPVVFVRGDARA
jgi:hypothetical protein